MEPNARAIAAYWTAMFRGQLAEEELLVFDRLLGQTDPVDGAAAIDEIAAKGLYPPTPAEIARLAQAKRKVRIQTEIDARALPEMPQRVTFAEWLRDYATPEETVKVAKYLPSMGRKFGLQP